MGLDVYLYKVDSIDKMTKAEAEYESAEENGVDGEELDALALKLGLGEYGEYPHERIEIDSAKYPDHYFKIGYWRSSYNSGGINSVMRRAKLPDLYDIMATENGDRKPPDWEASRDRAKSAIERFDAWVSSGRGEYDVCHTNGYGGPSDEAAALDTFFDELNKKRDGGWNDYSNINGEFHLNGLNVFAIMPGKRFGMDGAYVIFKKDPETLSYYRQALEIVLETIEWVLSQPDHDGYFLSWSG